MPLAPRYDWSETEEALSIYIHGVRIKDAGQLLCGDAVVKLCAAPHLLVLDLFAEVDDDRSSAAVSTNGVRLKLRKVIKEAAATSCTAVAAPPPFGCPARSPALLQHSSTGCKLITASTPAPETTRLMGPADGCRQGGHDPPTARRLHRARPPKGCRSCRGPEAAPAAGGAVCTRGRRRPDQPCACSCMKA
jgi:hypothetical protein